MFAKPNLAWFLIVLWGLAGCSFHYREGQRLETEKRWEEAAIEYRLAFVDSPHDQDVQKALARVNPLVAQEQFQRYQEYLSKKDYKKAYRRLEAAAVLMPENQEVRQEFTKWQKVLLGGKVNFHFDRLQANIRLADEMQLQVLINTPTRQVLEADIANENGLFFVEDLLYQPQPEWLALYSIHAIGLKLSRTGADKLTKKEFKRFIDFRDLSPNLIEGRLALNTSASVQEIQGHRQSLLQESSETSSWFPSPVISYRMQLGSNTIEIQSPLQRIDFLPDVLYLNLQQQRSFVDFGTYDLHLNESTRLWGMQKLSYRTANDDYFALFAQNLALHPYFFYREGAYRYRLAP